MIEMVIDARPTRIGELVVGRVLPFRLRRMVGPFIFMDHAGPIELPPNVPRSLDVRPHPHIGLSTVTYLFAGELTHRDSLGIEQVIRPGEVNWMKAGRGITHSERFDGEIRRSGGHFELVQTWVALPEADEESAPTFQHVEASDLHTWRQDGLWARLIAGDAFGYSSPVRVSSPLFYIHAELEPRAELSVPSDHEERALYVSEGAIDVNGRSIGRGQLAVLEKAARPLVRASSATRVLLLGGASIGARHIWWNFVSSRKERIEQAKDDWRAGRFQLPVNDTTEFIALP